MDCVYETYAEKDLSQLKRVTLVIPTHNRNYYLSRCLWYHAHFPFAEIIVADSSDENKREVNRKTISDIQQMFPTKITYLEYNFPAEEYGGEIYRKWGDAVMHVNTEYSLSCTDKEFLIPTTVANCVVFLDEHPDYSIADGKYFRIDTDNKISSWQGHITIGLNNEMCEKRFTEYVNNPIGTQFALQRSKIHKRSYSKLHEFNLYDIRYGETIVETLPVLYGKCNRSENIMSLRDVTHNIKKKMFYGYAVKSESSYSRYIEYSDYPVERTKQLTKRMCNCIISIYLSNPEVTLEQISKLMARRYPNQSNNIKNINSKIPILGYIYNSKLFPYYLKQIIDKKILRQRNGEEILSPENNEIRIILNIIKQTNEHYIMDYCVHQKLR